MPTLPPLVKNDPSLTKGDFLQLIRQSQAEKGDIFRIAFGKNDFIFVCDPVLAREVLIKRAGSFAKLGAHSRATGLKAILGNGLLTNTNHDLWKQQRRLLQTFFKRERVAIFADDIIKISNQYLDKLRALPEDSIVDLEEDMLELSQSIIYKMVFSLSSEEAVNYPLNVPLGLATASSKKLKQARAEYDEVVYALIEKRRKEKTETYDLLNYLLQKQKEVGFSDKQMRDELVTVFAAGHETTANAMVWAFYVLSQEGRVREKLLGELDAVIENGQLKFEDLKKLAYLELFFKELFRLYPTIPSAPRVAMEDSELGGFAIPAGSRVFVSIYANHMNKKYWHEPTKFLPERFLKRIARPAYFPFGLGERVCLGKNLAGLEPHLVIAQVTANLLFQPLNNDIPKKVAISLSPRHGLKARFKFR